MRLWEPRTPASSDAPTGRKMRLLVVTLGHNDAGRGLCAEGETVFKKIVFWLVIAFVVYFILKEPDRAGEVVRDTANALNHAGRQVLNFFDSIV